MKIKKNQVFMMLSVLTLMLSLIPVLYLCRYVRATGDDFGFGVLTHSVWLDTHSLWEVFKAAAATVKRNYIGWQGTWFTMFLFSLQPEVFSPNAYWIVPIMMLMFTAVGVYFAGDYFLVKKAGLDRLAGIAVSSFVLFLIIQFVPSTKSGIFWFNGTTHYIIPLFFALVAIWMAGMFIDTGKRRYLILNFLCMTLLGGSSYLAALLAPIVICFMGVTWGRKNRRTLWLLIPMVAELVGLIISFLAPGNKARGGEDFGFSFERIIETIINSFYQGFLTIGTYIMEKPVVFLFLVIIAFIVWNAMREQKKEFGYKYPIIFIIFMFCTYSAMFAPGLYAGTNVSGGVPNTIFYVFVFTAVADIVYCLGWLSDRISDSSERKDSIALRRVSMIVAGMLFCIVLYAVRGTVRETTFFVCVDFITSGQAEDYREQMAERQAILLDDSIRDAELPAMNSEQGPFMHMEVLKDPEAWTSGVVRDFYRKDSVVQVDRK